LCLSSFFEDNVCFCWFDPLAYENFDFEWSLGSSVTCRSIPKRILVLLLVSWTHNCHNIFLYFFQRSFTWLMRYRLQSPTFISACPIVLIFSFLGWHFKFRISWRPTTEDNKRFSDIMCSVGFRVLFSRIEFLRPICWETFR
jgi:hypothetical protein